MTDEVYRYIDLSFKVVTTGTIIFAFYQLREVVRKRTIDMYWKITDIYYSDEQREARKNISNIGKFISHLQENDQSDKEIIDMYNKEYHLSELAVNKDVDNSILNRIRFLNQTGVLLRKKLIDKELLFGLIGAGFEIDYATLTIVLSAHRTEHNMLAMYKDMDTAWSNYNVWKTKNIIED